MTADRLAALEAENERLKYERDVLRVRAKMGEMSAEMMCEKKQDVLARAEAAEAALTEARSELARLSADRETETGRGPIDAFGISVRAIGAGAPGLKPVTRDAIAAVISRAVRAALKNLRRTDGGQDGRA